jgi:hypothetical protein
MICEDAGPQQRQKRTAASIVLIVAAATVTTGQQRPEPTTAPDMSVPAGASRIEQTEPGAREPAALVAGFDGLGEGFEGPQGTTTMRSPSDNSIAVGPNHIVVTVNSRMAILTKKGTRFDATGRPLYGPVNTNNVFKRFVATTLIRESAANR